MRVMVALAVALLAAALFAGTSQASAPQVLWADSNCSGGVDPVDSLFVLRGDAGLPSNTGACPEMGEDIEVAFGSPHTWGDFDCLGGMSPVDSLKVLRFDAGLSVSQAAGCPAMSESVTILPPFALTSDAYEDGEVIPVIHACDGANTTPQLSWTGVPFGTQSFFLSFIDVDANDFVHWLVYDLPAGTSEIPAGGPLPAGADEGMTSFGGAAYGGPCPPAPDGAHEYVFTLYALDTELNLGPGATGQQLAAAIDGHILGIAELTGFYDR